jgi:methanogenic corrinoid protein MtbC1
MTATAEVWPEEVSVYVESLRRGDRRAALQQVRRLRSDGHDTRDLLANVLAPAQLQVGRLWVEDEFSVAQEHAATAISELVLSSLAIEAETAEPRAAAGAPSVVVACVEQEWHALPALLVAEYLRLDGYAVSYLGANASAQHLVRHIHEVGPSAVLLSCSLGGFLTVARRQIEAVRETGTPVVVGGAAFDDDGRRAATLGANAHATSGRGVGELVGGLPSAVSVAPPLTHAGATEAYVIFGDREGLADEVERTLLQRLTAAPHQTPTGDDPWLSVLDEQMPHVVGSVAGALVTGDDTIVTEMLAWADMVVAYRSAPSEVGEALREALRDTLSDMPVAAAMLDEVAALAT